MDKQSQSSAVIDMDAIEEMTIEDQEFTGSHMRDSGKSQGAQNTDFMSSVRENMASYMWQEGRQKAQTAIKSYANVDLLRPYFDVEPFQVLQRLLVSFVPIRNSNDSMKVPSELYGPTMLCFTLVAVLLFEMKSSNHHVQEGTLMGTALITVFGYWLGVSALLWLVAYVCNTHLRPTQITSLLGYALTSHVLVTFLNTVIHTHHSHLFFYVTWAILGGMTTAKIVAVVVTRTPGHTERLILAGLVSILHMLFLLYLHFAYHKMVEDLSDVLEQRPGDHLRHRATVSPRAGLHYPTPASGLGMTLKPRRLGAPTRLVNSQTR